MNHLDSYSAVSLCRTLRSTGRNIVDYCGLSRYEGTTE